MEDDNDDDWDEAFITIPVKQIFDLQEKDEEPIRLAVEEVLLPSLQGEALYLGQGILERFGAYTLYAATEAVSGILSRHLARINFTRPVIWDNIGDIRAEGSLDIVLNRDYLVYEVARFVGLWADGNELQVNSGVYVIVTWVWEATKYQPNLLCNFVASTPEQIPYVQLLTKIPRTNRIDDCRQRWRRSPSKQS